MRLKKLTISVLVLFPLMISHAVSATATTDVLIVELQVRSNAATGAADQEFVELYNTTNAPIDVSAWKLQYKSATGSSWSDKVTLHGNLPAHGRYLLTSDKYPNPPTALPNEPALAIDTFNAGLSDSAGHIRLVDTIVPTVPLVHDTLGWGSTANAAEGNAPASAPAGGKSLQRKSVDGNFIDTDNNASDFEINASPSPQADALYVAPVEPEPAPATDTETPPASDSGSTDAPIDNPPSSDQTPETPSVPPIDNEVASNLLSPQITELLPNPAAPASDSTDEFIELYNPNDQPINLTGYKLQSGNTFSYSYTFKDSILAAHEYKAFLVTETGDILSNSGGQARLLDSRGDVGAQTNVYDTAKEGQAWALINDVWQWTSTPTPNATNVLTSEPIKTVGVVKAAKTTTSSAKPKAATKTAAVAKPKSTPTKSTKSTTKPERQVYEDPADVPPSVHPGVLVAIGIMTLLYAAYEYRYDAFNLVHRFQRYRSLRRAGRTQA